MINVTKSQLLITADCMDQPAVYGIKTTSTRQCATYQAFNIELVLI